MKIETNTVNKAFKTQSIITIKNLLEVAKDFEGINVKEQELDKDQLCQLRLLASELFDLRGLDTARCWNDNK